MTKLTINQIMALLSNKFYRELVGPTLIKGLYEENQELLELLRRVKILNDMNDLVLPEFLARDIDTALVKGGVENG